jgi:hypothetical protein
MLELGRQLDFAEEAHRAERRAQLGTEHLEGHQALVPRVAGEYTVAIPPCPSSPMA